MELANIIKSLADETRLRLFNLLLNHELNVNEIVGVMKMGQSRISRHLKILSDSGLLKYRRDGLWIFYKADETGPCTRFIRDFREQLKGEAELESDLKDLESCLEERYREKTRFFDAHAGDWDTIRKDILGGLDLTSEIICRVRPGAKAADLGCGNGDLLASLNKKVQWTIGVDKSPRMLEEARARLLIPGCNTELRLGEIEHLPLRDGEVDCVILNMVLHHLPSPARAFAESGRVLSQGGTLICADLASHTNEAMRQTYNHRWLGFEKATVTAWLAENGFVLKETIRFAVRQELSIDLYLAEKANI